LTRLRLRSNDLAWRMVDDEIVAVDLRTSTYLNTNGSGAVLWRALADGATDEELVALLVDEFGIDADRAHADVDRFVDAVRSRGLLGS
jgi:Coenzyme PQQ synthesis protein D (PqqD)